MAYGEKMKKGNPGHMEGHGEPGEKPNAKKGTFYAVGTYCPKSESAISSSVKTGHPGAGQE